MKQSSATRRKQVWLEDSIWILVLYQGKMVMKGIQLVALLVFVLGISLLLQPDLFYIWLLITALWLCLQQRVKSLCLACDNWLFPDQWPIQISMGLSLRVLELPLCEEGQESPFVLCLGGMHSCQWTAWRSPGEQSWWKREKETELETIWSHQRGENTHYLPHPTS